METFGALCDFLMITRHVLVVKTWIKTVGHKLCLLMKITVGHKLCLLMKMVQWSIPCLVKLITTTVPRGNPSLLVFTSGTIYRGAYDNSKAANDELASILKEQNMYERRVQSFINSTEFCVWSGLWFHVDAANCGEYLAFLEMAINRGLIVNTLPKGLIFVFLR